MWINIELTEIKSRFKFLNYVCPQLLLQNFRTVWSAPAMPERERESEASDVVLEIKTDEYAFKVALKTCYMSKLILV